MIKKSILKWLVPFLTGSCIIINLDVFFSTFSSTSSIWMMSVADKPKKLKVHFYGGSITYGRGLRDFKNKRYSAVIGKMLDVDVSNKAIPATGVSRHITCGIAQTDILISEYRINENSKKNLIQWYKLVCRKAKHVVILDLWSWLKPPGNKKTATVSAVEMVKNDPKCSGTSFSILSLSDLHRNTWQCMVPLFFKPAEPDEADYLTAAPQECFDLLDTEGCDKHQVNTTNSVSDFLKRKSRALAKIGHGYDVMLNENQYNRRLDKFKIPISRDLGPMTIDTCKELYTSAMQHGLVAYHDYIGKQLVKHIQEEVMVLLESIESANKTQVSNESLTNAQCYGYWGDNERVWGDDLNLTSGFQLTSPFSGRKEKITLNTDTVGSSVILDCPSEFKAIQLYYIGHSLENETVTMSVESLSTNIKRQIITKSRKYKLPPLRVLYNTEKFQPPIIVTLVKKQYPGTFLEIALTACSKK